MSEIWREIETAKSENRYELKLSGPDISKKIEQGGIHRALFSLKGLNFLQCSDTCLEVVPDDIGKLENLTSLLLHSNKITSLPSTIGKLTKLKLLDVSSNRLEYVPREISQLGQLTSLNLTANALKDIPSLIGNTKLSILDLSHNQFENFPDICHQELVHLSEVKLNGNKIKEIPSAICNLSSLKLLDIADNCITVVPGELADAPKLKELNLKGNSLSDRRLFKLVDKNTSKQVLDYVRQHCPRSSGTVDGSGSKGKKGKKGRKDPADATNSVNEDVAKLCNRLEVLHVKDTTPAVKITEAVKTVRPHIACCIVRDVHLTAENLKKFIQLQTKLHETVCDKRNAATIATHDLDLLPSGDLTYTALPPATFSIKPLSRAKEVSGQQLFQQLQQEAEDLRKEKKRNVYSGVHKYLYLLEGKSVFPVLLNSEDKVVSFPPITNSDITKLSLSTRSLFLEVTSAASQTKCRQVLDTLLTEMLNLGLGDGSDKECNGFHSLCIEQVKIVDVEGNLKVVYPARHDLIFENSDISVIRE
ncbi:Protein lap4 [Gryllus bimaculatus]|nr:Protein lap4 [Gryllus bimaculatus]